MKSILILLTSLLAAFAFTGCTKEGDSAPAVSTDSDKKSEGSSSLPTVTDKKPEAAAPLSKAADTGKGLLNDDASAKSSLGQISKISGFSDQLTSAWNSIKGLDFSEKAAFLKQAGSLASTAMDNIGMLKQIAPMLSGDSGKVLIQQISGLSDQAGSLSSLISKGGSIASGNWGSYKDEIGSAIKSLSGGFSGLSKLAK